MNAIDTEAPLLDRMIAARQLSVPDAATLRRDRLPLSTEEEVLRWLAREYDLPWMPLDDITPEREVLSLFPARILL